jgi:hypothetical protein
MVITFTVDDATAATVINGICLATGWTAASGISQGQWAKNATITWWRAISKQGLAQAAAVPTNTTVDGTAIT